MGAFRMGFRSWRALMALLLAAVFATAGVSKLATFTDFLRVVRAFEILPSTLVAPATIVLVSLELTTAAALTWPPTRRLGAHIAGGALVFFLVVVGHALSRGLIIDCGCFAFLQDRRVGWGLLAQNSILLVAAAVLALAPREPRKHLASQPNRKPE